MPAGDRYVEVTLDDMKVFLKRYFRSLRPRQVEAKGEIAFDLNLSDDEIFIRVWTSIRPRSGSGAGLGEDAIRVTMITKGGRPLVPKGKIVMRTKNWRNALQDRIEDLHEAYESKAMYWKNRRLERDEGTGEPRDTLRSPEEAGSSPPSSKPGLRKTTPGEPFVGEYSKLPSGDWGVKIRVQGEPGLEGMAQTKGGQRRKIRLVRKEKSFRDPYHGNAQTELWTFEDVNGRPRQQGYGGSRWAADDALAESVAARYLNA